VAAEIANIRNQTMMAFGPRSWMHALLSSNISEEGEVTSQRDACKASAIWCFRHAQDLLARLLWLVVQDKRVFMSNRLRVRDIPELDRVIRRASCKTTAAVMQPSAVVDSHLVRTIKLRPDSLFNRVKEGDGLVAGHCEDLAEVLAKLDLVNKV